jgi:hypothetical protein
MSAILDLIADLHGGEQELAAQLLDVGGRHKADHDVNHITTDLAAWSNEHVSRLAGAAEDHGMSLSFAPAAPGRLAPVKEWLNEHAFGRHPAPGLLLLSDLQAIYLAASYNSLHWEMLAQAAQALSDESLLELTTTCHPETLRQIRWANTKLKESAPQILASLS